MDNNNTVTVLNLMDEVETLRDGLTLLNMAVYASKDGVYPNDDFMHGLFYAIQSLNANVDKIAEGLATLKETASA